MTSNEIAGMIFLDISERLAFMFGDPVSRDNLPTTDAAWASAKVEFKGEVSGSIALTVPRSLCLELAANILGLDPDDLEYGDITADALSEMLNVVAGHIVRGLQGDGAAFSLSVPVYEELGEGGEVGFWGNPETHFFDLDGSPVLLTLQVVPSKLCPVDSDPSASS